MTETNEVTDLLARWRGGDQDAARQLFDRYSNRLIGLSRQRISRGLAGRVDPEDVYQSVMRSFLVRARAGGYSVEDEGDLWSLLARITIHKTLRQIEYHRAAKRNPGKEATPSDVPEDKWQEMLSREPDPEAAVAFQDQLEHFFAELRPSERAIVELRLQGETTDEICAKLGIYDRKVRRTLERVRALAEREVLPEWARPAQGHA